LDCKISERTAFAVSSVSSVALDSEGRETWHEIG
jgi:hypothetical protein